MNHSQQKAWDLLVPDEQTSLTLSKAHGKSTWQAGEIMGKAHYKYLEIKQRAEFLFRTFTKFYSNHGELFKPSAMVDSDFIKYITLVIEERQTVKEASDKIESQLYWIRASRDRYINENMERISLASDGYHKELYDLILEFDRWNNFRILPSNLQMPSAYKRRNKGRTNKHLKNITSLPKFALFVLEKMYMAEDKTRVLYLPIVSEEHFKEGYAIMPVENRPIIIEELTKVGLFLFELHEVADDFAHHTYHYVTESNRHCRTGQQFWPRFRELSKLAINYRQINNIPLSKDKIIMAFRDLDRARVLNQENNRKKGLY